MKQFTKIIETCKDCPNLTSGAMSKCLHDKKNPKEISSFLDTIEWLKDKENVKLKSDWLDDTYAIANLGYLTAAGDLGINGPFDPEKPEHYALPEDTGITGAINSENLVIDAVKTPSQLTNKIYAGLGYAFNEWKYPLMLGIGSDYEFANNNAALEQWAIWLKLGLSF